jgi:ADP-heptose:LPS heptosyltransferase
LGPIPALTVIPDARLVEKMRSQLPPSIVAGKGLLVALHISARKEKQRWPIASFAQLARGLHAQYGARFLLFWSPGDENNPFHPGDDGKVAQLIADLSDLPIMPMPTEHLSELIAGLSLADCAVLSDGGAMHVAAGLGKPLVCFFGNSSAERWHPWGVSYRLLQADTREVSDISVETATDSFREVMFLNAQLG